jgi:hypothetical protein
MSPYGLTRLHGATQYAKEVSSKTDDFIMESQEKQRACHASYILLGTI